MTNQPPPGQPPTGQPPSGQSSSGQPPAGQPPPQNWETWLSAQPQEVQTAYDTHVTGLRNAVRATRDERDTVTRELKDAVAKLAKGSDAEKTLTEMIAKAEVAERRASFYEEAIKPEIGCRNVKVAFALAQSDGLFDRKGNPDWVALKALAPELFGDPKHPAGNAGTGTNQSQPHATMNTLIRRAAGRE